tara:strand:+ start:564 stop:1244 length:681 start_codon:yes stop_codon:yes gene_type:complete
MPELKEALSEIREYVKVFSAEIPGEGCEIYTTLPTRHLTTLLNYVDALDEPQDIWPDANEGFDDLTEEEEAELIEEQKALRLVDYNLTETDSDRNKSKGHSIVYNNCFGGFTLSEAAVRKMAELGHKGAMKEVANPDGWYKRWDDEEPSPYMSDDGESFQRHDPELVKAVEILGSEANGQCSKLAICELPGDEYDISEYDGWETIKIPGPHNYRKIMADGTTKYNE